MRPWEIMYVCKAVLRIPLPPCQRPAELRKCNNCQIFYSNTESDFEGSAFLCHSGKTDPQLHVTKNQGECNCKSAG